MKFFSEFGSCFHGGGATVPPAAETCYSTLRSSSRQRDENGGMRCGGAGRSNHELAPPAAATTVDGLRKMKASNTSRNWKPKLQVISEDSVVKSHDSSPAVRSVDKLSVKVKAKSKPKVSSFSHGDDYWKSPNLWALPAAFSPTPFAF